MNYVTIKIWEDTRRLLRLLAADSGEQMVEIMHRLCIEECQRRGLDFEKRTPELTPEPKVTPGVTNDKRRHNR